MIKVIEQPKFFLIFQKEDRSSEREDSAMETLPRAFYGRDTLTVARELLGKYLTRELDGRRLVCRITETEAYIGRMDKACHAYNYRRTPRTETLFAPPGTAYLYLVYGMYHCLNFVTEAEGEPCAVLIRGCEAVEGRDDIARLRYGKAWEELSAAQRKNFLNGPGKVCRGLALTRAENGLPLTRPPLFVQDSGAPPPDVIHTGKRIGIDYAEEAVDFPWRFWV